VRPKNLPKNGLSYTLDELSIPDSRHSKLSPKTKIIEELFEILDFVTMEAILVLKKFTLIT